MIIDQIIQIISVFLFLFLSFFVYRSNILSSTIYPRDIPILKGFPFCAKKEIKEISKSRVFQSPSFHWSISLSLLYIRHNSALLPPFPPHYLSPIWTLFLRNLLMISHQISAPKTTKKSNIFSIIINYFRIHFPFHFNLNCKPLLHPFDRSLD